MDFAQRESGTCIQLTTIQPCASQISPYDGAKVWTLPQVKHTCCIAGNGEVRCPARLAVVTRKSSGSSSTLMAPGTNPAAAVASECSVSLACASYYACFCWVCCHTLSSFLSILNL